MMQLGMPTLIETASLKDCVCLCGDLGLDFNELNLNLPQYQIQQMELEEFRALAKGSGLYYTLIRFIWMKT